MINKFIVISIIIFQIYNPKILNEKQELSKAYFASGCFWCVESIYENLKGVVKVDSGYSGGFKENPSYNEVISGKTGHAETIEVIYNPNIIEFKTLVKVFFGSHDPSTLNKQGPDVGTQYRSIAFYTSKNEKTIIEHEISGLLNKNLFKKNSPVVLYGGSVDGGNVEMFKEIKEIDGFLIGGASLKAKDFLAIYSSTVKHLNKFSFNS